MIIDHVTIRTNNLASTKAYFLKVFEVEEKQRPKIIQRIPGHWLYYKNKPLIHLIGGVGNHDNYNTNAIDHVGFKLENYTAFKEKLQRLEIPYFLMDIQELNERRIFINTPEKVLLELVFNEEINN